MDIVGRLIEKEQLATLESNNSSDFLVVYGRRRIGKTFLLRTYYNDRFALYVTGLKNGSTKHQINNFYDELLLKFKLKKNEARATNWMGAFKHLIQYLEKNKATKKIIFFDELPWIATAKSDFLMALEHFWNHWASRRKDILLIACGSAASWIIKNILQNKGGLHNRVTQRIKLEAFTAIEAELFLKKKGFKLSKYELVKLYMILGGVPFYLSLLNPAKTVAANIDALAFKASGALHYEYNELYASLFKAPDKHYKIIETLASKNDGLGRDKLIELSKLANGGTISKVLLELEECGFIHKYIPLNKTTRDAVYKIADFFTLFHLKFIAHFSKFDTQFWALNTNTPRINNWAGMSFELFCYNHTAAIKRALKIEGLHSSTSVWRNSTAQVDLVLKRADGIVNLFEIKFSTAAYSIKKDLYNKLIYKAGELQQILKPSETVHTIIIAANGLVRNKYADSTIQGVITLNELFT
jgi:uncharacterized protein